MARGQAVAYDYSAPNSYDDEQQRVAQYWQEAAYQEAARVTEVERRRLEAELQARLNQVGAEVELLESLNRRHVGGLRRWVFFMFLLAVAIAGAAGWFFTKKVKPRMNVLQSMIVAQQTETDRMSGQLREQTERARSMEERFVAARAELDRLKKPADPPKVALVSEPMKPSSPAAPQASKAAPPPQASKAASPVQASPGPKATRPPPPAAPPPPKKACNCTAGDPMCGCL